MAERDVVRITFKEIEGIVRSSKDDGQGEQIRHGKEGRSNRRHRRSKRPEQAIYRPGQLRLNRKERESACVEGAANQGYTQEEENWDLEVDVATAKDFAGTTDEDSSRDSKENSVDKELDGVRDRQKPVSSSNSPVQRERERGGRRRGKRPDIQIYVPKGRLQEQEAHQDDENEGGNSENIDWSVPESETVFESMVSKPTLESSERITSPAVTEQNNNPRKVDLSSHFGALQVTVMGDQASPTGATLMESSSYNHSGEPSRRPGQRHKHSGAERGGRKGWEEQNQERLKQREGFGDHEVWAGEQDTQAEEQKGDGKDGDAQVSGRHLKEKEEEASWTAGSSRGDGDIAKHQNWEHPVKMRDDCKPSMGRGRQRHLGYQRSSSNESLTKSLDLGQRGSQWPDRTGQHSGTFPRAKGAAKQRRVSGGSREAVGMERSQGTKHSFSSMRRQRERSGSISSDTSGGSDLSWEDLEAEMEESAADKPDWHTQVEQHLEQVARQVQDSTQRLTDNIDNCFDPLNKTTDGNDWRLRQQPSGPPGGLNRTLSASSDRIFSQEYRGRKKDRRRRGSRSKNSSRDSSIHSNPHDDDLWPPEEKKPPRRRNRRRHSSAGPAGRVGTAEGQRAAESLRILVGKNKEKRQVMVDSRAGSDGGTGGEGQRRHRQSSGSESHRKGGDQGHRDKCGEFSAGAGRGRGHHGGERWKHEPAHGYSQQHSEERKATFHSHAQYHHPHDSKTFGSSGQQQVGRHTASPGLSSDVSHPPSAPRTGGLIKLPTEAQADKLFENHLTYNPTAGHGGGLMQGAGFHQHGHADDRFRRASGQGHTGAAERRLYDPKNPSKPIVVPESRPLKFHDPEETSSPQESFTPPPVARSPGPAGSPGIGHAFPPFFPPHPGFMYPPPHMPMPHYPGFPHHHPPHHPMFYGFQLPRPSMENGSFHEEGYFNREIEQVSGMSRTQCRLMAEQILRDTAPLDCQLGNILSRGQLGEDGERRVRQLRQELQRRLERVILLDIDVASQHSVEQQLWRSVFYNVIEGLRHQVTENTPNDSPVKQALTEILDEGTSFYEGLLNKLQETYSFNLDSVLEDGTHSGDMSGRGVRLAVLSAQRTMMFLGDIARYREQALHAANYGKARHWYMRAQKLAPKNGRPYNQLAILAVYTRRKLDAVYYYQRSLAASNPILTARESLMSLFDEVRRKEEAVEQKRLEEARRRHKRRHTRAQTQPRVEVWIAPDGSSCRDPFADSSSGDDDLISLSAIELNKRFVLTFLNVHGKLFTKINFEVFVESASLMLQEWRLLLQHSPAVVSSTRLLQIMAINMFSIDNTALKDERLEASCRSLLQDHAVEVGLDMFGILVTRVTELFELHLTSKPDSSPPEQLSDDLRQFLPGVKVWVDWMMCHSSLWNPQPSIRPPDIGPQVDVWHNVARLCNTLKQVDTTHITLYHDKREGCEPLVLMEDSMMAGFIPLLSAPVDTVFVKPDVDKECAQDCLRVEKVVLFGEYLCGIEPPMLAFDVERGRYYSVAPAPVRSEEKLAESEDEADAESQDVIVESEESGEDGDDVPEETIQKLKALKAELSRRVEDQARDKNTIQTMLDENRHAKLELEVRPRFLVADTNCFIDHLSPLRTLLAAGAYVLVVPLVVLNELDGLAKGSRQGASNHANREEESPEHKSMVMRHAGLALTFLESEFKGKNPRLRVQTSKGSILETLAFRSEEADNTGNNDDLILSCCLHYCKDMARDFMPRHGKDSPVRLFRDVVLLTDDRNLRLKAHTSNVPVKDVPAFCRWSKIT